MAPIVNTTVTAALLTFGLRSRPVIARLQRCNLGDRPVTGGESAYVKMSCKNNRSTYMTAMDIESALQAATVVTPATFVARGSFYTYLIEIDSVPRYVGVGTSAPSGQRVFQHERDLNRWQGRRGYNSTLCMALEEAKQHGSIVYRIIGWFEDYDQALETESWVMNHLGRVRLSTGTLFNLNASGGRRKWAAMWEYFREVAPPKQEPSTHWFFSSLASEIEFAAQVGDVQEVKCLPRGGLAAREKKEKLTRLPQSPKRKRLLPRTNWFIQLSEQERDGLPTS